LISPTITNNIQLDVRIECIFDNSATASATDINYIKEVFKKKYPPRSRLNKTDASTLLRELNQNPDKTLLAYYERALTILHLFDGRDLTEATNNTPLTGTNKFLLSTVVKSFTKGIYNKNIQAKAIDSGASTSAGLYASFLIVKEAKEKIEIGKTIVKEEDIEEMIRLLQQNKGQQFTLNLSHIRQHNNTRNQPFLSSSTQNRPYPNASSFQQPSNVFPNNNSNKPNTQYHQGSQYNQGNQSFQPQFPQNPPSFGQQLRYNLNPLNPNPLNNSRYNNTNNQNGRSFPDPATSSNPYINRSIQFTRGMGLLCY
jgi:hypothetical protein